MSNYRITDLTNYTNPDPANDVIEIVDNTNNANKKITRNNLLGITSTPVGINDIQTLTQKTLTAPTISSPILSGTMTGTYTLAGTPTFPSSVVTLTGSQTLTNKILTSPTINAPTITNASITADAITGFSSANTGTIYGIAVTSSQIGTAAIASNAVTGAKIASYSTSRRNNTANIVETAALIQTGWVAGQPGVAANITFSITFPVAYTNIPIVIATFGGDTAGVTSTLGAAGANVNNAWAEAYGETTTTFSLRVANTTNWAANNTVYAKWMAIGT